MEKNYDLPADNVGEVTLIGTGGGYGESIIIHAGFQNWIVVDSCINPNTQISLPLEYLQILNVDILNNLKMIVCSHWDNDHILGLSQLVEMGENARLFAAKTHDPAKFTKLISRDYDKATEHASNSSTGEFNKIIQLFKERKQILNQVIANNTLNTFRFPGFTTEIIALSPSQRTMLDFDDEIVSFLEEYYGKDTVLNFGSPNSKSMVLYLKLGEHRVLLGADLEVNQNPEKGWLSILAERHINIDKKASLFKIPHHGSENGYHKEIWTDLLEEKPVSKLTPWNRGSKLPIDQMLKVYQNLSEKLFVTSQSYKDKKKDRNPGVERIIKRKEHRNIREDRYSKGIIRCRINLDDPEAVWTVDLFGKAVEVNNEYFS